MQAATKQCEWNAFLKFFSEQHWGRPTRLGVFEPSRDVASDRWLECGLPLMGVDLDARNEAPAIQIMVGTLEHEIKNVIKVSCTLTPTGDEDGLDVLDGNGSLTVLRFETNTLPTA